MNPRDLNIALCDVLGVPHDAARVVLVLDPHKLPMVRITRFVKKLEGGGSKQTRSFDLVPRDDKGNTGVIIDQNTAGEIDVTTLAQSTVSLLLGRYLTRDEAHREIQSAINRKVEVRGGLPKRI